MENVDSVPVDIKIKYLVNLIRQKYLDTDYELKITEIIEKMHK